MGTTELRLKTVVCIKVFIDCFYSSLVISGTGVSDTHNKLHRGNGTPLLLSEHHGGTAGSLLDKPVVGKKLSPLLLRRPLLLAEQGPESLEDSSTVTGVRGFKVMWSPCSLEASAHREGPSLVLRTQLSPGSFQWRWGDLMSVRTAHMRQGPGTRTAAAGRTAVLELEMAALGTASLSRSQPLMLWVFQVRRTGCLSPWLAPLWREFPLEAERAVPSGCFSVTSACGTARGPIHWPGGSWLCWSSSGKLGGGRSTIVHVH